MSGKEEKTNIKVKFYLKMLYIISLFFRLFFPKILEYNSMDLERNQVSILIDEA